MRPKGKQSPLKVILIIFLLLISAVGLGIFQSKAVAPPTTDWIRTYGVSSNETATSMTNTTDGGYVIAGTTVNANGNPHFWLIKTNSQGIAQWNKTYMDIASQNMTASTPHKVIQTSDGGYAIVGSSRNYTDTTDFLLVKTDSSGNQQWNKTYAGPGNDEAFCLVQTSDSGYAIAGYTTSYYMNAPYSSLDMWLVKTDAFGTAQWNQTYGGTNTDEAYYLVQTSDNGYAIAGCTTSYISYPPYLSLDMWLVKTDRLGTTQWNITYGGTGDDIAYKIIVTRDGGYALAGETSSFGAGGIDIWLVKTSSSGNVQWNKTYGGTGDESRSSEPIIQTSDGGYALAAKTTSFGPSSGGMWLVKTDSTGNITWNKTYGLNSNDNCCSVTQAADGGYLIAGSIFSTVTGSYDFYLAKTLAEDIISPQTTLNLTGTMGDNNWYTSNLRVNLTSTDNRGVSQTGYSFDKIAWLNYTNPFDITSEGNTTVYYNSTDLSLNTETTKNATVKIDKTPPQGSIIINDDAASTNTANVALKISATDLTSGVAQMHFSNDNSNYSTWQPFVASSQWTLQEGSGTKIVYAQFKDNAGLISQTYSDTIFLNQTQPKPDTPPNTTINCDAISNQNDWFTSKVTVTLTATDDYGSCITGYSFDNVNWLIYSGPFSITKEGQTTIYYNSTDSSQNIEQTRTESIKIDSVPPTGAITINDNAKTTSTTNTILGITATDDTSGVAQMRFSNDNADYSTWQPFSTSYSWTLQEGNGTKTVYTQFKDNAGLISQTYSDTIEYVTTDNNILLIGGIVGATAAGISAGGYVLKRVANSKKIKYESERSMAKPHTPVVLASERIVNTGFSSINDPGTALNKMVPLSPNNPHYFWFEVGSLLEGTIEVKPEPLNIELLPSGAKLTVALFSFNDEIKLTPGKDVGKIQIVNDGSVKVVNQVERPAGLSADQEILDRRLFFPVQTPNRECQAHLRCNVYYEQILVESRLITAQISSSQKPIDTPALQSKREYTISKTLNPNNFALMQPQTLSVMLNDNGDGTHSFRMMGIQDFKESVSFNIQSLETLIGKARGALRKTSWGTEEPWTNEEYRYSGECDEDKLREDFILLAVRGFRFWFGFQQRIAPKIVGDKNLNPAMKLNEITLKPGIIEFAIKDPCEASDYMFPVSMIYDYPLDTDRPIEEYTLCPAFLEARKSKGPLEKTRCFNGNCPSRGKNTVICPSGFWGFRHSIGLPLGIGAPEINPEITYSETPQVDCAAFLFDTWEKHRKTLESLKPEIQWQMKYTHDETVQLLKHTNPHLVYFYCEGGAEGKVPYIQVGTQNEMKITPDNFSPELCWGDPKPLVFINGCRTAALDPKLMMDFVSAFVVSYHASGVVGTEIQVFEKLAAYFGEECLRRFLVEGETIGNAVRATRLDLLKQGNPLGLVYTAYANNSLRLKKTEKQNG